MRVEKAEKSRETVKKNMAIHTKNAFTKYF